MSDDDLEEWLRTGRVRCADCDTLVRCPNLTSLPSHRCLERRAQRDQPAST